MSAVNVVRFTCDCPGCPATVEAPGSRYDYELGREKMPEGWHVAEGRFLGKRTVACPEHSPALREAERARYEWERAETEARNRWMRENPSPVVPAWIDPRAMRPRERARKK